MSNEEAIKVPEGSATSAEVFLPLQHGALFILDLPGMTYFQNPLIRRFKRHNVWGPGENGSESVSLLDPK